MKPIKKLPLILPIIIILFSFVIVPVALAVCDCQCTGDISRGGMTNKDACVQWCDDQGNDDQGNKIKIIDCKTMSDTLETKSGRVYITDPLNLQGNPSELYARIVSALLGFVGIASLVTFVYAGFMFLISAGNSERVKKAKDTMLYAIIGIVVSIASYAILSFIFKTLEGATGQ